MRKVPKHSYPHEYFGLSPLQGERWKHIPDLEDYYMISNYGRIKRLTYERIYRNGAVYIFEEKIIKPAIVKSRNNFKNDTISFLVNRVTLNGIKYNFSIGRLVYYCFVKKYDLSDKTKVVFYKDNNHLNIIPSNLKLATLPEKSRRIADSGRMSSPFKNLSPEFKQKQRQAIIEKISKPVSRYSLKGVKIKTYPSAAVAERATGIYATSIGKVASGGGVSAGGYRWQWGKARRLNISTKELKQNRKKQHREKYGLKVSQYDFSGKRIACFPSLQDAEAATGVNTSAIRLVLKGEYKSAKGYYWKKGYGKEKIDLSGYKWGRESMAVTQSKKVNQYTLKGKLLKTYKSIKEAAGAIGVTSSVIIACCKGHQNTSGGYIWRYAKKR